MEILKYLKGADFEDWGHNGYVSQQVLLVTTIMDGDSLSFKFISTPLDKIYIKDWETIPGNIERFNKIIVMGHSFGAYNQDKLIGMVICEERKWNNTLHIENILIAEKYRRKGIGKLLIKKTIEHSKSKNFRLIELETQNTNIAAISFYRKQGFEITGLNLKLYNEANNEIAIFMTYSDR